MLKCSKTILDQFNEMKEINGKFNSEVARELLHCNTLKTELSIDVIEHQISALLHGQEILDDFFSIMMIWLNTGFLNAEREMSELLVNIPSEALITELVGRGDL